MVEVDPLIESLYRWSDISGVLLMGIIGGTMARKRGYDIIGFFFIAMFSSLGGGMVRDVLRGHVGLDILAVVAMVATLAVGEYIAALIIVLMLISMMIGAFGGLTEKTIRRVLGYQMLNGMPFILVMLAFTSDDPRRALAAGIMYTIHHMLTVGSLILASGAIEETYGTGLLSKLSGLARRDPVIAWIFAAGAFSVVGFPPFSGIFGKVTVVLAAASAGDWRSWVAITAIIVASFGARFVDERHYPKQSGLVRH